MVAPTVRNGEGGVEGQMEELKKNNNPVHFKGKCEGEMISGARTVRRGAEGVGRKESSGATGGQRRRARSSKHHLISHKSLLNSSYTKWETEDQRSKGRA